MLNVWWLKDGKFFLHSCFISDTIVFFVTFLAPIFALLLFNVVMFILAVRVLVIHSMKKKKSVKSTIKTMISIVGIMVMFGLTWLFGALTVREASTAFQYLFVIFNGFQGFFFFIFNCLISKDGREFWTNAIVSCCGLRYCTRYSSLSSKLSSSHGKRRTGSTSLGVSNPNYRSRCMSASGFSSSELQSESNMRDRLSSIFSLKPSHTKRRTASTSVGTSNRNYRSRCMSASGFSSSELQSDSNMSDRPLPSKVTFKSRPSNSSTSFGISNPNFVPELLNRDFNSGDDNGIQPENKLKKEPLDTDIELGVMLPRRASIIEKSLLKEIEELLPLYRKKQELEETGITESDVEMETTMTQSDDLMYQNMEANATQEEVMENEDMKINDLVIMNHAFDQGLEDLKVAPSDEKDGNSQYSEWNENEDDDCKILT